MTPTIGIDFDNTIARYDHLMHQLSVERKLVSEDPPMTKMEIRQALRNLEGGEDKWRELQATVYGPKMGQAALDEGVESFVGWCRKRGYGVYIVSHKTKYSEYGDSHTNLRESALEWMARHRFFEQDGLGFQESHIFFEDARRSKVKRIGSLGCTHFIDDLEETFLEEGFPDHVQKILYCRDSVTSAASSLQVATNWEEVKNYVFNTVG
jgi:hypothetical protein